jgi:transposase-like protein
LEEKQRIVAESYGGPRLVSVTARRWSEDEKLKIVLESLGPL